MKVPILKLGNILMTSIQIDLTDNDAMEFQSDVLKKIGMTEAMGIVIDITVMDVVDSFLARMLNDTARMAKLLGAEVVICGMQPAVALTLIEMGREFTNVETALNMEYAMDKLQELIADRERVPDEKNGVDSE